MNYIGSSRTMPSQPVAGDNVCDSNGNLMIYDGVGWVPPCFYSKITRPTPDVVIFTGGMTFCGMIGWIVDTYFEKDDIKVDRLFGSHTQEITCHLQTDETIGKFEFVMTATLNEHNYDYKNLLNS